MHLIIPFVFGILLVIGCEVEWMSFTPHYIQVNSVTVKPLQDTSYELVVDVEAHSGPTCIRLTQHALYRDVNEKRSFVPLATAMSGLGFLASRKFTVILHVPVNTDKGKWNYVNRSTYLCSIWPGLTKLFTIQIPPTSITLD